MVTRVIISIVTVCILLSGAFTLLCAQQPQIPTLQVCNQTQVKGKALVKIASRSDAIHSGIFTVIVDLKCDPAGTGYPAGTLKIVGLSMSDSLVQGTITAASIEQMTSTGKHTPTVYLNGRCKAGNVKGCRFWLMIADNKQPNASGTPDVVGFLVFNGAGQRVAYGTGPVVEGDIDVAPTGN